MVFSNDAVQLQEWRKRYNSEKFKPKVKKGKKMACLREYRYEILLKNTTLKECETYIKKCSEDVYLVPGGYKVKDITLLGSTSPVGFSGNDRAFAAKAMILMDGCRVNICPVGYLAMAVLWFRFMM